MRASSFRFTFRAAIVVLPVVAMLACAAQDPSHDESVGSASGALIIRESCAYQGGVECLCSTGLYCNTEPLDCTEFCDIQSQPACVNEIRAVCAGPTAPIGSTGCDLTSQAAWCNAALTNPQAGFGACGAKDPNVLLFQQQLAAAGCAPGWNAQTDACNVVCYNPPGWSPTTATDIEACGGLGNMWWYALCPYNDQVKALVSTYSEFSTKACSPVFSQGYPCFQDKTDTYTGMVVYYDPQCHNCVVGVGGP